MLAVMSAPAATQRAYVNLTPGDPAPWFTQRVRDPQNGYASLPLPFDPGRGNELTVRTR